MNSTEENVQSLFGSHRPLSDATTSPGAVFSASSAMSQPGGTSGRFSVSPLPVIVSFLSSLSPAYAPESKRQILTTPTSYDTEKSIRKSWEDKANDVLHKVKLASTVASSWVPPLQAVCDVVATLCSSFGLAHELGNVLTGASPQPAPGVSRAALATLALVTMDNLASVSAVPAPGERGSPQKPIRVPDSETLSKIGQAGYPADAFYLQNNSFHHNSTTPGISFKGHYDGGCHTISDLRTCLFADIERHGVVSNLRVANAHIDEDSQNLGAVACAMAPYASARDIQVEHAFIDSRGVGSDKQSATVGVITGLQQKGAMISDIDLRNCTVFSHGDYVSTGMVGGLVIGELKVAKVLESHVMTLGREAPGGIGAGELQGLIEDLGAADSVVTTGGVDADAAIGAGYLHSGGKIKSLSTKNCHATTAGNESDAGIGGGLVIGRLEQLTIVHSSTETRGTDARAGLGGGQVGYGDIGEQGVVDTMVCVASEVATWGEGSSGGIAAGSLNGNVHQVTSVGCRVETSGNNTSAGIGAGVNDGRIINIISVNDTVRSTKASAGLGAGDNRGTVERVSSSASQVNGVEQTVNPPTLEGLCLGADPRFVASNCTVYPSPLAGAHSNCTSVPIVTRCGSPWQPIAISDATTLNSIGNSADYPADGHYVQTDDLDGAEFSNPSLVFTGHYDGQNHIIRGLRSCLINDLRGTLRNLQLTDARILSDGDHAAVVACKMTDAALVEHIRINNCRVTTYGQETMAGIISARRIGDHNRVARAEVYHSAVETHGDRSHAGVIAGQCEGVTEQVAIHHSRVKTRGNGAIAGLGGGEASGRLSQFSSTCSGVETHGHHAIAGIGAGTFIDGRLGPMTVIRSNVSTTGTTAIAGIGVGDLQWTGQALDINALSSRVHTSGGGSSAGVGAGRISPYGESVRVIAAQCQVLTEGAGANAGIGVGTINALTRCWLDVTSLNNTVQARDQSSRASIHGTFNGSEASAVGSTTINTRVNDDIYGDRQLAENNSNTFCARADPRLVYPDCQINRTALPGNCVPLRFASLVALNGISPSGLCSPPALLSLDATSPPLVVSGLSTGASIGIGLGVTVFLLGAAALTGWCCLRSHRVSPEEHNVDDQDILFLRDDDSL